MILIGRYVSPFVRRVGATMIYQGLSFEHQALRAGGDEQDEIRKANPLGRVPTLLLDDSKVLADSAVILDYLDSIADPGRVLAPQSGWERFEFSSLLSIATGAAEKAIFVYMETRNRPAEKVHQPAMDNAARQARDGFEYLCHRDDKPWLFGASLTQLDISAICYWSFIVEHTPMIAKNADCGRLDELCQRVKQEAWFDKTVT